MKIAILGGGIAGVTAAYQLARLQAGGAPVTSTLFEATPRLGGIIETVRTGGYTIECGPEAWVTDKPWASELAAELALPTIPSLDAQRRTYLLRSTSTGRALQAIPQGMRLMVPTDLAAIEDSPLLTAAAKQTYREEPLRAAELKAAAPQQDESVASFVRRHFGDEVTRTFAAPLLAGVFGGDVETLSVRAVMPTLVAMEREHGSLVTALAARQSSTSAVFTTLRDGMASLISAMAHHLRDVRLNTPVTALEPSGPRWRVHFAGITEDFDAVILATPADATRTLLQSIDPTAAELLPTEASSAAIVALAFAEPLALPPGFGFLSLAEAGSPLLAATFTHQKFVGRVPPGGAMLRAFFSGEHWMQTTDAGLRQLALHELSSVLGELPTPHLAIVRRWPRSLPQYAVGHTGRIAQLMQRLPPNLRLIGNAYTGVGLPDLIRTARQTARSLAESL
ncbi:MAG TPA: protoporphyrinogen oxidase [Acidobacteriaceae bacterium]